MNRQRQVVTVHHLDEMRAALRDAGDLGQPVLLLSAPGAAASLGAMTWAAMTEQAKTEYPDTDMETALDCGAEAGMVMNAMRHGLRCVIFTGAEAAAARLARMADRMGVIMLRERPKDAPPPTP